MLKPLQIGTKTFPINLIQGPLAGVSCAPFRLLTWEYSKPAFSCTEMISCKTLVHQPKISCHPKISDIDTNNTRNANNFGRSQSPSPYHRYLSKAPSEGPVCFQLSGNDPAELSQAVQIVTAAGADLIDLNCGCPVKKIRSKGAGSKLLTDPLKLYHLISAMKRNTHLPVSIKIRVEKAGEKDGVDEKFNQEIANVVSDAGADFLIVHGRHWTEHYETPCRHDQIQFFVQQLKIPVIGNGDISDMNSLRKMFATGCAGVMIGRAGVGQPWLIAKLAAEMTNQAFIMPTHAEIGAILLRHAVLLAELLGNEKFAVLQIRKLAKYYARPLPNRMEFVAAVNQCENLQMLNELCKEYFYAEYFHP